MSVSTDGQICYGVAFPEEWEFPWMGDEYSNDIHDWWRTVCGFKPPFEIFNDKEEWIEPRPSDEKVEEYWDVIRKFDKEHPVPEVEVVNYCSCNSPMYIIAVKSSYRYNSRGYPEAFSPSDLTVTDKDRDSLLDFIGKYCMDGGEKDELKIEPKWYLSSYWG